jgi:hypothetical protein
MLRQATATLAGNEQTLKKNKFSLEKKRKGD